MKLPLFSDPATFTSGYSWIFLDTADDLKQVSRAVSQVELSDHLVEVVFTLFDENSKRTTEVMWRKNFLPQNELAIRYVKFKSQQKATVCI